MMMRIPAKLFLMTVAGIVAFSFASAVDLSGDPYGLWKPLRGAAYKVHSGLVGDAAPPTVGDRRLTILVDGAAAKDVFDGIGPDQPMSCSDARGDRHRRKQGIVCFYTAHDEKDKDGPYRCWIGLNLKTGATIGTIAC
jgi:hypothetical protein